ncbi:MAG: GIY-YIG nuclease family protein [Chloroflexi bacterium]|nr:GIY-YIG nuclease family protein [Chloroflexota bacterium]MBM4450419.1 GIY-YIG nuclease family protein [Chloroflexota bacterium]
MLMFFLCILQSEQADQYYIGSTKDVSTRLAEHNAGKTPSTKRYRPWRVIHTEAYCTLSEARQRERQIKSWKSPAYMIKTLGLSS